MTSRRRIAAAGIGAAGVAALVGFLAMGPLAVADDPAPDLGDPLPITDPSGSAAGLGTPDPDPSGSPDTVAVSDRGNVIKALGEPGELTTAGSDEVYFEITVHDVLAQPTCPGRGVEAVPESGGFLVLDVGATMTESILTQVTDQDPEEVFLPLVAESFTLYDAAGAEVVETATEAAWGCFENEELLPPFVGPGESYRGYVVLDANVTEGTIGYNPGGAQGWEWSFGG